MLIGFFRSNRPSGMIALPCILLLMWLPGFLHPSAISAAHTMPLFEAVAQPFLASPFLTVCAGYVMVIINAFYFNYFSSKQEFFTRPSWIPALALGLLLSCSISHLSLYPVQFAIFFLQVSINKLLESYRKETAHSDVFDAALWMGIATLFYFPMIVFLLFLLMALLVVRPFIWREWLITLTGFFLPYLFAGVYYFYVDKLEYLWYDKIIYAALVDKNFQLQLPAHSYILGWVIASIILLSIFRYLTRSESAKVKTTKAGALMLWVFFFSAVSLLLAPALNWTNMTLICFPATAFIAAMLLMMSRKWMAELLIWAFLASVIISYL